MLTLERYKDNLPERPYYSNTKRLSLFTDKDTAVGFPYIQVNNPWRANYLAFDLDFEGAAFAYERHDLPAFTLCAVNPENAYAHGFYEIDPFAVQLSGHVSSPGQRGELNGID